jgi:hypothetical protein
VVELKYVVLRCPRCSEPRYVREDKKDFYCFRCRAQRSVREARWLFKVDGYMEAVHAVQQLKLRDAGKA